MTRESVPDAHSFEVTLVVYVSRRSAASTRAVTSLQEVLVDVPQLADRVEVVDVTQSPDRARADGVYVTPALRVLGREENLLLGALDDKALLRSVLLQAIGG